MVDYSLRPGRTLEKKQKINNNEEPVISVVTPFYNGGETLLETTYALLNQTYPFFEWIIVDDGSKDKKSLEELAKVEKMDKRIKVYHKENGGPSVARDFGISKASKSTEYVLFLDCDDLPEKNMLEVMYWSLKTNPDASFAYTAMTNFGDAEFIWEKYLSAAIEKKENLICICSMIKKEDLLEVGCFGIKEKAMYEDWNLWLKLLAKGKKPLRISCPLFWYRFSNKGEFSRAKENHEKAMKYINESAKNVSDTAEVIQFPNAGKVFDVVKPINGMTLPDYESKKNNVLFIFPWLVVGGADLFNLELISRLDKNKFNSYVCTTLPSENPLRQKFCEAAESVYDLSSFLNQTDYINFIDYLIKSRKINTLVVSNSKHGYYMIPALKNKYSNLKIIDYIHSVDLKDVYGGFGRCTKDVEQYIDKTYTCNNFTSKQLNEVFDVKNTETLYIGTDDKKFDPEKFNKKELRQKYGIPENKKVVSFIARLSEEKRPELFLKVAKELLKKRNDLLFIIAGDGGLYSSLKKMAEKNENIQLLGQVNKTNEIYSISDVTVNCSALEGLALTSYESLSMGVPVISSDVGGQKELIDSSVGQIVHYNSKLGFNYAKEEIKMYSDAIENVLKNISKIKINCRNKITEKFTYDKMINKFKEILINKKAFNATADLMDTLTYQLALEKLYPDFFWLYNNYCLNKYGINPYKENMNSNRKKYKESGKTIWFKKSIKNKSMKFGTEKNIYGELRHFLNFYRNIVLLFKNFCTDIFLLLKNIIKYSFYSIVFLIKSIISTFIIIFKVIFIKNKRN